MSRRPITLRHYLSDHNEPKAPLILRVRWALFGAPSVESETYPQWRDRREQTRDRWRIGLLLAGAAVLAWILAAGAFWLTTGEMP